MRWEDERYIRWYTNDTPEWCVLPWTTRALWGLILRELDRTGVLKLGKLGLPAIAVAVRAPWDEIEADVYRLLDDGCLHYQEEFQLVIAPNFLAAQEAAQTDRARSKASRERARDRALAKERGLDVSGGSTTSQNVTPASRAVTQTARNVASTSRNVSPASRPAATRTEGSKNGKISPIVPDDVPDDLGAPIVTKRDTSSRNVTPASRNERFRHDNPSAGHSTLRYATLRRAEPYRDGATATAPGDGVEPVPNPDAEPAAEPPPPEPAPSLSPAPPFGGSQTPLAGDAKLEADTLTLAREIARHRIFVGLEEKLIARRQVEWMLTSSQRLEWVIASVEKCAAKNEGQGLQARELQRALVEYMRRARDTDLRAAPSPPANGPGVRPEAFDFSRYGKQ